MNELLVDRLKHARAEQGLKQSDVAEKLGLKANTISNWEKGRTEPDIDSFVKLIYTRSIVLHSYRMYTHLKELEWIFLFPNMTT